MNRDKHNLKQKEYYQNHKKAKSEYNKQYHKDNKTEINKKNIIRYHKNKEKYLPKMRIYGRAWEKRNRQKRNKDQLRNHLKFARIFNLKSWEYKDVLRAWSQLVRNRDDELCRQCGNPATVSHHIIFKKTMPELSLNLPFVSHVITRSTN